MADKGSLGRMAGEAISRLEIAMALIADRLGVERVEVPRYARDAAHLNADQLQSLAGWAEAVVAALEPGVVEAVEGVVYPTLTVAELKALAAERGLDLGGAKRKDDIIALLVQADAAEAETQEIVPPTEPKGEQEGDPAGDDEAPVQPKEETEPKGEA